MGGRFTRRWTKGIKKRKQINIDGLVNVKETPSPSKGEGVISLFLLAFAISYTFAAPPLYEE